MSDKGTSKSLLSKFAGNWIEINFLFPFIEFKLNTDSASEAEPEKKSRQMESKLEPKLKTFFIRYVGFGKSNIQIAKELKHFIYEKEDVLYNKQELDFNSVGDVKSKIQLYGYYSAYDHVALSWIFGKMVIVDGFEFRYAFKG